mmetsp:Transcript_19937/g.27676  ORF Transcript_19937/g.27676 Transcript_19937/m.27676 type:complete len:249 (-) Transcript_19937:309-1055(-)
MSCRISLSTCLEKAVPEPATIALRTPKDVSNDFHPSVSCICSLSSAFHLVSSLGLEIRVVVVGRAAAPSPFPLTAPGRANLCPPIFALLATDAAAPCFLSTLPRRPLCFPAAPSIGSPPPMAAPLPVVVGNTVAVEGRLSSSPFSSFSFTTVAAAAVLSLPAMADFAGAFVAATAVDLASLAAPPPFSCWGVSSKDTKLRRSAVGKRNFAWFFIFAWPLFLVKLRFMLSNMTFFAFKYTLIPSTSARA